MSKSNEHKRQSNPNGTDEPVTDNDKGSNTFTAWQDAVNGLDWSNYNSLFLSLTHTHTHTLDQL